jgi:hypothetical protein
VLHRARAAGIDQSVGVSHNESGFDSCYSERHFVLDRMFRVDIDNALLGPEALSRRVEPIDAEWQDSERMAPITCSGKLAAHVGPLARQRSNRLHGRAGWVYHGDSQFSRGALTHSHHCHACHRCDEFHFVYGKPACLQDAPILVQNLQE